MKFSVNTIIFDFDGVLLESNEIRTEGFRKLLTSKQYSEKAIEELVTFHEHNGGLSRYYKLRYLHEKILNEQITEGKLKSLCNDFSAIVKQAVAEAPWVNGAHEFLKDNCHKYKLFIVSGSDQKELREICQFRSIDKYVMEILGSPVEKKANISSLISKYNLNPDHTLFIGDAVNDFEASQSVDVSFIARDSGNCGDWSNGLTVIKDLSELPHFIYEAAEPQ